MLTREAIERVIAELETRQLNSLLSHSHGRAYGYGEAIHLIKEVLNHEGERGAKHNLPTEKEGET